MRPQYAPRYAGRRPAYRGVGVGCHITPGVTGAMQFYPHPGVVQLFVITRLMPLYPGVVTTTDNILEVRLHYDQEVSQSGPLR